MKITKLESTYERDIKNFENENQDLRDKLKNLENQINEITKKRLCPYPNCDSTLNFRKTFSNKHFCLDSCPKWHEVIFYLVSKKIKYYIKFSLKVC